MTNLKECVISAPALCPIDYQSGRQVIVAVDSSQIAVGWIVFQMDCHQWRKPARYGSIAWNDREARYSQAKIELYGLYRCLRALRMHVVGLPSFTVEVDAKYIRGMLNNPDIQPNNAMNRWIAGILLFDFNLVHVPGTQHGGPDRLSRRRAVVGEVEEKDDGWLERVLELGVWVTTWREHGRGDVPFSDTTSVTACPARELEDMKGHCVGARMPRESKEQRAEYGEGKLEGRMGEHRESCLDLTPVSFLTFSILEQVDDDSDVSFFPQSDQDRLVDARMARIMDFLTSGQVPTDLDDVSLKRFLHHASRFFIKDGILWRRHVSGLHQHVVRNLQTRRTLLTQAHDQLGHKGFFTTRRHLTDRFWWPAIDKDIKWFLRTCHECQIRSNWHVHIPPTVLAPAPLFRRVHIDTMHMPKAGGFSYIIQARCSLISYPEFRLLRQETAVAVGKFIFNDLLCHWGAIYELVTDNGTPIIAGLDWLAKTYHINHIRISPYNKQANGVVERSHRTIRESLVRTCAGDIQRWPEVASHVFWADRVTIRKDTGYSPFYMAHGVKPVLPFNVTEATYLTPSQDAPMTTEDLLALRARQLEKRQDDLMAIRDRVLKARHASIAQFEKQYANLIVDYNFASRSLVLVRNTRIETDLSRKTKPRYLGPLVVIRRTWNGAYILAELNGAVSKLPYAAFRLIPYLPRSKVSIPVTSLIDNADMSHGHE